jgi:hypothetical protein
MLPDVAEDWVKLLQTAMIDRKTDLLHRERLANGRAKDAITGQLQALDALLIFIASKHTEEDMTKLKLTLEKQAIPVAEIQPRQENKELTEALIDLAKTLQEEAQKKKEDIMYPLNALPPDIKPKSVTAKIWALRSASRVPENVLPSMRTIRSEEGAEKYSLEWPGKPFMAAFIKWVKNPPPIKSRKKGE